MNWGREYCCDCTAAVKAQVLLFSEGRVLGRFATLHSFQSLLLHFTFYKLLEPCNKPFKALAESQGEKNREKKKKTEFSPALVSSTSPAKSDKYHS